MGIEDPYNWQCEQVQNAFFGNSENAQQDGTEMFIYEGNRMPTTAELETKPNGKYRQTVRPITNMYPAKLMLGEHFDIIPKTTGGGSSTHWATYFYGNGTGQLFLVGGYSDSGAYSSLVYVLSSFAFSNSLTGGGARLAYFGKLTFVNGAQIG